MDCHFDQRDDLYGQIFAPAISAFTTYMDPPRFARYLIIDVRENHCSHISGLFMEVFDFLALMVICAHTPHHPSGLLWPMQKTGFE